MAVTNIATAESDADLADVVLQGGPPGLAPAAAVTRCSPLDRDRLKIPHAGGYEHYVQLDTAAPAVGPRIFSWVRRTAVAE
jgi:hypothetical protein